MRQLFIIATILICSSSAFGQREMPTYKVTEISEDPTYGLSEDNPINVGYARR